MAILTINSSREQLISGVDTKSISFNYMGEKIYNAKKVEKLFGVWVSNPICMASSFLRWNELAISSQKFNGTDIWIYVRSASLTSDLEKQEWKGPFLNISNNIESVDANSCIQIMIILKNDGTARRIGYSGDGIGLTPIVDSISVSYISSAASSKFYTVAFDIGFVPKHILLVYEGDIPDDAVVRFAVSGFDTIDSSYYQYITPNQIEELTDLSLLSDKIKLMVEMISDSTVPVVIHEIGFMFSGAEQDRINKGNTAWDATSSSSQSSSSSSSSEGYSSSSSSNG